MSLARCEGCDAIVDTDEEPEAYVFDPETGEYKCLCFVCRELEE